MKVEFLDKKGKLKCIFDNVISVDVKKINQFKTLNPEDSKNEIVDIYDLDVKFSDEREDTIVYEISKVTYK